MARSETSAGGKKKSIFGHHAILLPPMTDRRAIRHLEKAGVIERDGGLGTKRYVRLLKWEVTKIESSSDERARAAGLHKGA